MDGLTKWIERKYEFQENCSVLNPPWINGYKNPNNHKEHIKYYSHNNIQIHRAIEFIKYRNYETYNIKAVFLMQ
jgi:hypothetical protein